MKDFLANLWRGMQVLGLLVIAAVGYFFYSTKDKVYVGDISRSGDKLTFKIGNPNKVKQDVVFWVTSSDKDKRYENSAAFCNYIATLSEEAQQAVVIGCDKIPDWPDGYTVHVVNAKWNEEIAATAKRIYVPTSDAASAASQCDDLGASDYDNDRLPGVPGVGFAKLDAPLAEQACANALSLAPQNLRLMFQAARSAQKAGEYKEQVVALYKRVAESGYVAAMANYAAIVADKNFVDPPSEEEAYKWARNAAEGNNVVGMFNLGERLRTGNGVPEDDAGALSWVRKSAEGGFLPAMSLLAFMLATGKGAPPDRTQAMVWAKRAQDRGDPNAQQAISAANQSSNL